MARRSILACLLLLAVTSSAERDQSRWSRQISSYTADISDWVPLPGPAPVERQHSQPPIKRQAVAEPRILAEPVYPGFTRPTGFSQDGFGSQPHFFRNSPASRPLYLQSVPAVPSAPQNYLSDQGFGQSIRFGLSQPSFPLNQGFVSNQFPFDNIQQINNIKPRPQQVSNPVKFENFLKAPLPPSPQAKPFITQPPRKIEAPKFIDGYRAEPNNTNFRIKKPQSLQKLKFESFEKIPKTEMMPPMSKSEKEEVQLLYVPVESLNRGQFNFRNTLSASQLMPDAYTQSLQRPNPSKPTLTNDFQSQRLPKPDSNGNANQFFNTYNTQFKEIQLDQVPKYSTIASPFPTQAPVTPKPKKLKPHQPPLAIFMTQEAKKGNQIKVGDVLSSLKSAETIAVLDSVNPQTAPKVFIGPSSLEPPETFVKFELPYLSNIENSEKKIRQLPFFVAPLSYNTPHGFAKIPFPSPHVGSVVINSQIREPSTTVSPSTPKADVQPNSYSIPQRNVYKQDSRPLNQKQTISYYSTAPPRTNPPPNYPSNYYSIEPQVVSTVRTPQNQNQQMNVKPLPKPGSYFLSNIGDQYEPSDFSYEPDNGAVKTPTPVQAFNIAKQTESTTSKSTPSTTKASTYPNQLLETHNPYSINQAFHFSTPLDYHNVFDENYATPGSNVQQPSQPPTASPTPSTSPKQEVITENQHQSSPSYLQNYSPEIHYNSEVPSSRYPSYNSNDFISQATPDYSQPASENDDSIHAKSSPVPPTENSINNNNYNNNNNNNYNTQTVNENTETKEPVASYETSSQSSYLYNQYENTYESETPKTTSTTTTSTTTTTTTRRTPTRGRGRPRYSTTPRTGSNESSTRTVVTRRPLRERRPQPTRSRYEPNKITTERATRKPAESQENTTKYSRNRTRGRVQYKPSESDEYQKPKHSSKEQDLAYQRDVLHQNYPVTIQERGSTVDIEAITEPSPRISSTKTLDSTYYSDTENAYSNDRIISQQVSNTAAKEEEPSYTSRFEEQQTESPYISKSTFQSRSSFAPVEAISGFGETEVSGETEKEENSYIRQTTPIQKFDEYSHPTEPSSVFTEQNEQENSRVEFTVSKQEEIATTPEIEITKTVSQEVSNQEEEENVVQTTPSYNRVRVRPGVVRQYHQASSAEVAKTERRKPVQPVTYRPAFDRRRTTMRVEEIGEDFRTKLVHARPEVQEHRHPVYRPEPSTEPAVTSAPSQDTTTKRGVFRRRRPTYTTTTTEASNSASTKKAYEVKNRFRGRRPSTEKSTDKADVSAETTTTRNLYNRYSNRPRLSERYNKKPEHEEAEDQDSNYSITRPKYAEPESDLWSPKISSESFKPYNPNDIIEERKVVTETKGDEPELDIITAKNDYDDILLTVTPATNNRANKKIPDIPPTLEALVEQSKTTQAESDNMSTFESMLEEVMKNLEEQDEDEYTQNVMKHKGGEIGEIPPEKIISSGDNYSQKTTTVEQHEATTIAPVSDDSTRNEEAESKGHRRGFWKKVKVRPVTEPLEAAESQYYPNAVNRIENPNNGKTIYEKIVRNEKPKVVVTTYKPPLQFLTDIFNAEEDAIVLPTVDIPKLNKDNSSISNENKSETDKTEIPPKEIEIKTEIPPKELQTEANYKDVDLGIGSPNSAVDGLYLGNPTAPTKEETTYLDKTDGFSIMDYLFGITSEEEEKNVDKQVNATEKPKTTEKHTTPEKVKVTTEGTFIPDEITAVPEDEEYTEALSDHIEIKKVSSTVQSKVNREHATENTNKDGTVKVDASTPSSFMDPANVVSTSMSTEVSHETEICFRGKCIKTNNDLL